MQDLPYLKATTSNVILTHLAFVNIIGNFSAGVKKAISLQKQGSSAGAAAHTSKAISICVFPEKELRGLNPYFHIHVSERCIYSHDQSTNFPAE
jgi:hypothetical protein